MKTSTKALINETVLYELKRYLAETDSFFCKYVKKHLGQAPLEYRNAQLLSTAAP